MRVVYRPVRDPRLASQPLFRDEMVAVMASGHRLAKKPFVVAEDLAPEHLVLYSIPRQSNLVFREMPIPAGARPIARSPLPPGYLRGFVEVLARHPLPLGRTGRERRRIVAVVVEPRPKARSA